MLRRLASALVVIVVGACSGVTIPGLSSAPGPIRSEADAIAAVQALDYVLEPITIREVQQGRADHVYDGVYGSSISEEMAREQQRKRERPAWAVDFTAPMLPGCDLDPCVAVMSDAQIVFDAETGEILFSLWSEHRPAAGPLARSSLAQIGDRHVMRRD